jgi:chemotaxis protein MotB
LNYGGRLVKQALVIATILSVALVCGILGFNSVQQKKFAQAVQAELAEVRAASERTRENLTNSQARIEALIREKEEAVKAQGEMEQQMRTALQSKEVTISQLQGKLTVNIVDKLLFDSGEAELKPEGEGVLKQIAGVLANFPNRQIYVIGHTDNVPIRGGGFARYTSNWELSTARATAAVRYLSEKAGVDPKRLAAVGYGEFHPVAENATSEGKAKNRRIAIVVLPEQFNPLDLQNAGNTNAPAKLQAGASL